MKEGLPVSKLHYLFEASIITKGVQALAEITSGVTLLLTSHSRLLTFVTSFTTGEDASGNKDVVLKYMIKTANEMSLSGQHFISLYLLVHGLLKLFLVIVLFRKNSGRIPSRLFSLLHLSFISSIVIQQHILRFCFLLAS